MIKIAVMNTSKEVTDMLCDVFTGAGFETTDIYTYQFKNREVDFDEFINAIKPNVILYDIAIPYKENYELFQTLSKREVVKDIPFVVTTTNKHALDNIVGKTKAFEIIGKPYDLEELVEMVERAAAPNPAFLAQ